MTITSSFQYDHSQRGLILSQVVAALAAGLTGASIGPAGYTGASTGPTGAAGSSVTGPQGSSIQAQAPQGPQGPVGPGIPWGPC